MLRDTLFKGELVTECLGQIILVTRGTHDWSTTGVKIYRSYLPEYMYPVTATDIQVRRITKSMRHYWDKEPSKQYKSAGLRSLNFSTLSQKLL